MLLDVALGRRGSTEVAPSLLIVRTHDGRAIAGLLSITGTARLATHGARWRDARGNTAPPAVGALDDAELTPVSDVARLARDAGPGRPLWCIEIEEEPAPRCEHPREPENHWPPRIHRTSVSLSAALMRFRGAASGVVLAPSLRAPAQPPACVTVTAPIDASSMQESNVTVAETHSHVGSAVHSLGSATHSYVLGTPPTSEPTTSQYCE
jgi:hypothetical protein